MTLDQLPLGQAAKVSRLTGSSTVRRRLMEMGLTPAATVEAVRRAPMGDPLDVKVRGYHLSLRKEEAASVQLEEPAPGLGDGQGQQP
jgi:Fe2+ transport system protein FeoA